VASRFGTDHHEYVVKADALDVLPRLIWHFDEPFADSSAIPTYYVSQITRRHVTVALSGDGGDENFAGYRRYARAVELEQRMSGRLPTLLQPILGAVSRLLPVGVRGQAYAGLLASQGLERYHRLVTYERRETLRRLLSKEFEALARNAAEPDAFVRLGQQRPTPDFVSALQQIDMRTYLPDDILTKVDRTSMAVSLEARVPLLDHVLMEYVATIPSELKLRGGIGKYLLKRVMADSLPEDILTRRKMGFGVPLGRWLREELREMAWDTLLSAGARQRGIFRAAEIERLLRVHGSGARDYSARLWALLCFELWMRRWADGGLSSARQAA